MIHRMIIREVKEKGGERGRSPSSNTTCRDPLAITRTHEEEESNRLSHELHNPTLPAFYSRCHFSYISHIKFSK